MARLAIPAMHGSSVLLAGLGVTGLAAIAAWDPAAALTAAAAAGVAGLWWHRESAA
ncbi:MAG: hypothetical protein JNK45_25710, partial [Myxococcales bacterium]|nr:hypothetical protein [Myxococcales bacterium]